MRIPRPLSAFFLGAALLSLPAAVRAASPTLVSIEVSPAAVAVSTGSAALFTAVGTFSDASTRTLNGTWTSRAQMLESRTDSVGAFSGSKLFVFGGSSSPGFPFGTFNSEAYDVAADSWSVRSAAPVRRGGAFAAEYAGKIYVAGGCINADCNTLTTAVWEYDVALDSWTAKTALPGARFDAAMQQIDGKIYVAGGIIAGFVSTNTVHMYDPAADTWTARAPMPAARGLGASGAINGKLYVAGGRIDGGAVTGAEMQIYDPVANAWSLGAAMPSGRMATGGGVVNGRLYVVAGVSDPTAPTVADSERVQIYDPASNTWIEGSSITARYGPVVGSYQGKLYAAGAGFNNVATSSVQVLNADEAVWSSNAPTIGTVTASGSASGLTAGVAQITATSGAVSGFGTLTVDGPPAAPSAFAGAAQSTTSILWSWTDNSSNETGFRVMSGAVNLSGNLSAGSTSWLQTGLTANATSGILFARAYNSTGTADSGSLTRYSLADPPNSISATFFGSSVSLTWPAMTNPAFTTWAVDRATDGATFTQFYYSSAAAAYTDTGLAAASTYTYRIRAVNFDLVSSSHANATATVYTGSGTVPAIPTGFAGTAQTTTSILWSWTDTSTNETGFRVMAGATNVSGNLAADTTIWLQTGLGVNTSSGSLLVQAFNSTGTANSGAVTRYSLAAVPGALGASSVGLRAASIGWTAGGNPGGTVYALERSTGAGFGLRQSSATLTFLDTTLSPASTYYFRALAYNADLVASAYGSSIAVVTPPAPVFLAVSSITPSSGASGATVPAAVVGTGFDGTAVLTLERASAQGVWTATGSFATGRMLGALVKLGDGRVLLAGGQLEGSNIGMPQTDIFNPATGVWASTAPMLQGRHQFAAVRLADGRVLATGGEISTVTFTNTAEIYDPISGAWTPAAPMSAVRQNHQMILLGDGRVLAAGGWNGASRPAAAEIYDPATDTWSAAGSMSAGRIFPTMTMLPNGKVLVTGDSGATAASSTAELYDPIGNSWTPAGSMSASRYEHQAVLLPDGRVLVAGGNTGSGVTNTADVYDAATGSWTATGVMAAGRFNHAMVLVRGEAIALGGMSNSAALSSAEIYDAALNAWRAGPSLLAVRAYALAVPLEDGKILTASGRTGMGGAPNANTAEVLVLPFTQIAATGLSVSNAQNLLGSVGLAGAATGYWDVVVRESGGRIGRLAGGVLVGPAVSTPAAPSGFAGAAQSDSSILWTWTDNASNEDGFRVVSGTISVSGNLAANATFWLQSGLGGNALTGPYAAQAYNAGGAVDSSTASRTTLAAVPTGLAASGVYQTSGTVSWSQGTNAAGTTFELERSTGTGYGLLLSAAATYYFDGNFSPSATHYYRVRAINGEAVATAYSSTIAVVALPPPAVPGAPGTPAGTVLGISSINWTWALASGATNYFLYRASDGVVLATQPSGPFVQTGLSGNTAYGLRVAGVNLGGLGPLSAAATVYTWAAVPSGAAAVSIASTSLTASWGLNGNDASTVAQLDRSTNAVDYSTLTIGAVTSYADADLLGCSTYYYRVRNANAAGVLSAYASFTGVTANTVAAPPAGLTASANAGGSVSLAWNLSPTEGVTGYRLYWDAGTGTVSYAAPLAVLGSTATAYTTGVLTSSAAYTFALRTAHRCGLTDATGALAMSGAAVAAPAVRAAIKEPDSGRRIDGNSVTILAELTAGTPSDVQQIVFQYKTAVSTAWTSINAEYLDHPNPDFSYPYFTHADVTGLAAGSYDLRAVAYDRNGVPDSAPPAVRVVVDHTSPDISETLTAAGEIKKDQVVSNTVTSVVETAGDSLADPAVRVTIPAGTVNSATATVSVIANPVITTAAPTGQSFVGSAIKIDLSNGQTALNGTAAITLTYPDTVLFPALLQIFYLDEATGQWSRDFASTVNTTSRTVSGNTPHFSTFALLLGTAFAANLDSVQVYPVPYKPNGRNADEGRPFTTGDPNSGILFSNLARGATIKIYTLTGRLVSSLDNAPITGTVRWDAKNQDGRDVASGAYFAVISATGQKSIVKKLVIIR